MKMEQIIKSINWKINMRKSMKKIIKKLILLFCLALCITDNLTACSRSDIKKTKSNTETGYKITWYANVLQKNISNEYEVTDKIICNSEYNGSVKDYLRSILFLQ